MGWAAGLWLWMKVGEVMAFPSERLRLIASGLVASLFMALPVAPGSARAEPFYSFDASPGKLPKTLVPTHYAIDLVPDLDKLQISGLEVVDIEMAQPTDQITLNAVNMSGLSADIDRGAAHAETITFDAA